ncbi:hypothetical protein HZH66_014551 [Vespula vulgaris]|uniref:Uncharacterized protein n=1 Tax=Vespula vulgaris TaxID=7454 RepID=A0A834J0Z4_VESVU|nr:hypothetical protein HZH66_014551 [Vespula vulgaris]
MGVSLGRRRINKDPQEASSSLVLPERGFYLMPFIRIVGGQDEGASAFRLASDAPADIYEPGRTCRVRLGLLSLSCPRTSGEGWLCGTGPRTKRRRETTTTTTTTRNDDDDDDDDVVLPAICPTDRPSMFLRIKLPLTLHPYNEPPAIHYS